MLMIRYQRIGRTNDPAFRIVLLEKARAARSSRILEQLGSYNPKTKALNLDEARVKEWIGQGAQPTDTVKNLLIAKGVLAGKKADSFPSSARKKARLAAQVAEAEASAAAPAVSGASGTAESAPVPEVPAAGPPEEAAPAAEAPAAQAPAEESPAV